MALPLSGPLKMGDIRTELGMSGVSNFSLINASVGGVAGYPILNPFSPVKPTNTPPEYKISEWYGYSSATINWIQNFAGFGGSNLKIYINGTLILNNTTTTGAGASGTLVVNNGDTFYITMTPITYSGFFSSASIGTFRLLSPFNFPSTLLNSTSQTNPNIFAPFSSPPQTVNIIPTDLGVYEIDAYC
jgi:hypothetical protein